MPAYNVADYLPRCVSSALNQTYSHLEIILVDDGSTDDGPRLCASYSESDTRVKLISQTNSGLGAARNVGISIARGDFILFLDGDDYLDPNTIEFAVREAAATRADVVILGFSKVEVDGKLLSTSLPVPPKLHGDSYNPVEAALLVSTSASAKLFSRSLLLRSGVVFPPRAWYEDLRTIPKFLAHASSLSFVRQPLYYYVQRPTSIMRNPAAQLERRKEIITAIEDLRVYFSAHCQDSSLVRQAIEFLAVKHVLIFGTLVVARTREGQGVAADFLHYVQSEFPEYNSNPLVKELPQHLKLILYLAERRCYIPMRALMRLRQFMR